LFNERLTSSKGSTSGINLVEEHPSTGRRCTIAPSWRHATFAHGDRERRCHRPYALRRSSRRALNGPTMLVLPILPAGKGTLAGHLITAQNDILVGMMIGAPLAGDRCCSCSGAEPGPPSELPEEGHVDGHLITVEVGVVGGADQRVKLNGLTFDQHRLEGLNAEAMQGRAPGSGAPDAP
jgi:hypothetical protein